MFLRYAIPLLLLCLALAGFYLIPALVQRRFVQLRMAILPGMRPSDSFLFGHTAEPFHDAVLRSASWIAVGVLAVALACAAVLFLLRNRHRSYRSMRSRDLAVRGQHDSDWRHTILPLTALSIVVLYLLTRFSASVWAHAPQLAFLQFPWRFLSIEAAVATLLLTILAASLIGTHDTWVRLACLSALLFAAAAPWAGHALYRQACDAEDTPAAQHDRYENALGSEPTDEYTPASADNDALPPNLPAAWLTRQADGGPDPAMLPDIVAIDDGHPEHLRFQVRASANERTFVVRLRQFPGWSLQVDGQPQPSTPTRDDGLASVALPANTDHTIALHYRWTTDEIAGVVLSVAALLVFFFLRERRGTQRAGAA